MLVVAFLHWWYGPGWRDAGRGILARIRQTYLSFSIPILLHTMFAPWRRIITYSNGSLGDRLRAILDNTVSRAVGFTVRLFALIAAGILVLIYAVLGGIMLILWPTVPALALGLIVGGIL